MNKILLFISFLFWGVITYAQLKEMSISTPEFAEITPKISYDGTKLIFASNKSGSFQFYECERIYNNPLEKWSAPKLIAFVGGPFTGIVLQDPTYNMTSNRIYFAANFADSHGGMDIYYADRIGESWSKPKNAGPLINSFIDETAPAISADENYCYFVRTYSPEKKGEEIHKIHYARKNAVGTWQEPIQLTATINAKDENYPFLAADNQTLYFSSKAIKEPDGYNIVMSKMYAENIWSDPKIIASINNDFDIISPSIAANSNELLYAQSTIKKKEILADIFSVQLSKTYVPDSVFILKGRVYDSLSKVPLAAKINVTQTENMQKLFTYETLGKNGNYYLFLPQGNDLSIEVEKEGYSRMFYEFEASYNVDLPKDAIVQDFTLFNSSNLVLNIFDEEIFEPLFGGVSVRDQNGRSLSEDNIEFSVPGRATLTLAIGPKYTIDISIPNYKEYFFTFDLSGAVQFNGFEKDAELTPVKVPFVLSISDLETNEPLNEVDVVINNLDKRESITNKDTSAANGTFTVDLRAGNNYEILVDAPKGYAYFYTKIAMDTKEVKKLNVQLQPLKDSTRIALSSISFEDNASELYASSHKELNRVLKLLKDNPEKMAEIKVHTMATTSQSYNQRLADKRALAIAKYLIENKLPANRIKAIGYGDAVEKTLTNSEENIRYINRVELFLFNVEKPIEVDQETENISE